MKAVAITGIIVCGGLAMFSIGTGHPTELILAIGGLTLVLKLT